MNNRPPISSTSNVIDSYRKRRQRGNPNIVLILASVFVLGGIGLLVYWLTSTPNNPISNMLATDTLTPTMTFTPTSTSTPTETPTATSTATITATPTFSAPFNYTVQDGDYLQLIAEKFSLGDDGVAKIISLNPFGGANEQTGMPIGIDPATLNILPGQVITIPNQGYELPTATPIPSNLTRGTKIDYTVQAGDTLGGIAALFNSTVDDIMKENKLTDANALFAGQVLVIPVNLVTSTPTRPPTSTPVTPGPGTDAPTVTLTPIN
ncbi:MAG: LysM peptidoglycan-binding domain-containing protein [Anaerolineales bacterium]|nr:LysM peptidoglycan-binding domain-containing protein [Anaerolineales bacterium]